MEVKDFKVGMKVTSSFRRAESDVIRTLTMFKEDNTTGSGFRASADGGEPCECCGLKKGSEINYVDGGWFKYHDSTK